MTLIEAAKQACGAIREWTWLDTPPPNVKDALVALDQAIADAEQQPEPVPLQMDVIVVNLVREGINKHRARELAEHFIKHTTPPQRKPLTDEEIGDISKNYALSNPTTPLHFARAIEAAHGIKE